MRLSSFKGALRYWWRALAWPRLRGHLGEMRLQEDELFGSANRGQSRVLLRLEASKLPNVLNMGQKLTIGQDRRPVGEGARYLGYGVIQAFDSKAKNGRPAVHAGQLMRACLPAPFDFTVHLRCRDLPRASVELLVVALRAVGTLGGLGAKSRKGYGSLVVRSVSVNNELWHVGAQSLDELRQHIVALYPVDCSSDLPEITALSGGARHLLLTSAEQHPLALLNLVGRELIRYRSWGKGGRILEGSVESEKLFKCDHDLMKSNSPEAHPCRVAFGLPHNYSDPKVRVGPADRGLDRRASPLFIHIHECLGMPVAVLSFLPARFLPNGKAVIAVGERDLPQKPEEELYQTVHDFFDRLLNQSQNRRNLRQEPFTKVAEVTI